MKQERWTEQVENAINNVKSTNPRLKGLLTRILGFTNIPRKEAKFVNFLKNSVRINDEGLCREAWKAISEEAAKFASVAPATQKNGQSTNGATNGTTSKNGNASANPEAAAASTNGSIVVDDKQVLRSSLVPLILACLRMATVVLMEKLVPSSGR